MKKTELSTHNVKIPPLWALNHRPSESHLLQKCPASSATALCAFEPAGHEDTDTVWSRFWELKANCSTWHTAASMSLSGISWAGNWGSVFFGIYIRKSLQILLVQGVENMNNCCQLRSVTRPRHDKTGQHLSPEATTTTGHWHLIRLSNKDTVFIWSQVSLTKQAAARFAWRWTCERPLTRVCSWNGEIALVALYVPAKEIKHPDFRDCQKHVINMNDLYSVI